MVYGRNPGLDGESHVRKTAARMHARGWISPIALLNVGVMLPHPFSTLVTFWLARAAFFGDLLDRTLAMAARGLAGPDCWLALVESETKSHWTSIKRHFPQQPLFLLDNSLEQNRKRITWKCIGGSQKETVRNQQSWLLSLYQTTSRRSPTREPLSSSANGTRRSE